MVKKRYVLQLLAYSIFVCPNFAAAQNSVLNQEGVFLALEQRVDSVNTWFPTVIDSGDDIYLLSQQVVYTGEQSGNIELVLRGISNASQSDPIVIGQTEALFRDLPPPIYSVVGGGDGDISVALLNSEGFTQIFRGSYGGAFALLSTLGEEEAVSVSPRLYERADGGLILFVNQSLNGEQKIYWAESDNGRFWSDLDIIESSTAIGFSFLPAYTHHRGKEYLVFQALAPNRTGGYQLYLKQRVAGDNGWGAAIRLTDFLLSGESGNVDSYDNQRAAIVPIDSGIGIAWERRIGSSAISLNLLVIDDDGNIVDGPQSFTSISGDARYPQLLSLNGTTAALWFGGEPSQIYLSIQDSDGSWDTERLSDGFTRSIFPTAIFKPEHSYLFWMSQESERQFRLISRESDVTVPTPILFPDNFVVGLANSQERVSIRWSQPDDISGISGYSYIWDHAEDSIEEEMMLPDSVRLLRLRANRDGIWNLKLRAHDRAGNSSSLSTISYILDRTPPPPVVFELPETDVEGFVASNTLAISWASSADDVAGYNVTFRRLGPASISTPDSFPLLAPEFVTRTPAINRVNIDDGLWGVSVLPIDRVGNVGQQVNAVLRFNKYIPTTEVFRIDANLDQFAQYNIMVTGRGFSIDGQIDSLILDEDGERPFDYVYTQQSGDISVISNGSIATAPIFNINEGNYRLGLRHPTRGIYFAPNTLRFESSGTVVYGDYTAYYAPDYAITPPATIQLQADNFISWLVILFLVGVTVVCAFRIVAIVKDTRLMNIESHFLITGNILTKENAEERIAMMDRTRVGLRVKFTVFVAVLVVSVILSVALILSSAALQRQENILARGLFDRVTLLLDSVALQAGDVFIGSSNIGPELQPLTNLISTMPEAEYITITGQGQGSADYNHVWATNDQALDSFDEGNDQNNGRRLNTDLFEPGISVLFDSVQDRIPLLREELNNSAVAELGDIPDQINAVNAQIFTLVAQEGRLGDDPELQSLDNRIITLRLLLRQSLNVVSSVYDSDPAFDPNALDRSRNEYLFYRPILAWRSGDDPALGRYYRGAVRLGISTDILLAELRDSRRELIANSLVVALVALVLGIAGALLLAAVIINPINRLVVGVKHIQEVDDKSELRDHVITVKTKDEISVLANTINSMTQGLARAAEANKDLVIGQEIQKMFIPLRSDGQGNSASTALDDIPDAEFAGYYEGAKGVSGDYFTYKQLDNEHYAVIKCDVSGKGVSAALIMVQVATIFTDYFNSWTSAKSGLNLGRVVSRVNDLLEGMKFQGRFAALIVGIFNVKSGILHICGAGDTQLHVFRAASRKVETVTLPKSPAAGVFPSSMLPAGFPNKTIQLTKGDILMLFTDGLDESKRYLRTPDLKIHKITEQDMQQPQIAKVFAVGVSNEEFGAYRITDVTEAILARKTYRLYKTYNPVRDEELLFDFSGCRPTAENLVLGLMAVEKIFRAYKDNSAGQHDQVFVDKAIDNFLRNHFNQFDKYFSHLSVKQNIHNANIYTHVMEDDQYDDLTILAIRKK